VSGKRTVGGAFVVAPGSGRRIGNVELLAESAETKRFNLAIFEKEPDTEGPEAHVHADEEDAFYILEGELEFVIEGETMTAGPGTFVLVPPGIEHTFANRGDTPTRVLNVHAPAGWDLRIRGG
jgi:mannose-6-phosphate isomerase-like protein (cupin superfamily)